MAKYFCISSPAVCYDDLVQYYVMKQLLEDVAVAKADDAYYSQMANDFTWSTKDKKKNLHGRANRTTTT